MAIRNYRDLIAWQGAMDLTVQVYSATESWPKSEMYGLTAQTRKAAVSVPCNVAEGQGRGSDAAFRHFLSIAHGSLREVETCVVIGERLKYLKNDESAVLLEAASQVGRLITGLSKAMPQKGRP